MQKAQSAPSAKRASAIRKALEVAAQHGGAARLRDALGGVLPDPASGSSEEIWLAGELAYASGDFTHARENFSRFDERSQESAPWMRYLSLHRQSFSALQLGDVSGCERLIGVAEKIIDSDPSLEWLRSDVGAMRAHVAETDLEWETAWVHFERAYQHAEQHGHVRRMRTVASDLARIAVLVGRVREGLEWVRRARTLASDEALDPLLALDIREGMLHEVLREWDAAEKLYRAVLGRALGGTSAAVDVAHRLAELRRARGQQADAIEWYDRAITHAATAGLARHEAYAWLGKAGCLAELQRPKEARAAFVHSIARGLAGANKPTALVVDQLDVAATWPSVFGVEGGDVQDLQVLIERLRSTGTAAIVQRGTRQVKLVRMMRRAIAVLRSLSESSSDPLDLDGCVLDLVRGVIVTDTGESALPEALRSLVEVLAASDRPLSMAELVDALSLPNTAIEKRISRLRKCLPPSALRTGGAGREVRKYELVRMAPR